MGISHKINQGINELVILSQTREPYINKSERQIHVISTSVEKSALREFFSFFVIILMLLTQSCSSNSTETSRTPSEELLAFSEFQNFPEQQFLQIKLGMELELTEDILKSNGFKIGYDEDSKYYSRTSDSIEVVLPENDRMSEMIIFIKNEAYLNQKDELLSFLSKKSSFIDSNGGLTILEFNNFTEPFRLNYFIQKDYIRLKIVSI